MPWGWHCWLLVSAACRLCSTAVKSWTGFHHRKLSSYRGGSGGYLLPDCLGAACRSTIVDLSFLSRATSPSAVCVSASRICSTSALLFCCRSCCRVYSYGNVVGLASAPVGIIPVILSPIIGRFAHKLDMRRLVTAALLCMPPASTGVPILLNRVWILARRHGRSLSEGVCGGLLLYAADHHYAVWFATGTTGSGIEPL